MLRCFMPTTGVYVHPGDVCHCPRGEIRVEFPLVNVSEQTANKCKKELSEPVDPLQAAVDDIIANEDIWQTDDNPQKKQKQKQKPEPC